LLSRLYYALGKVKRKVLSITGNQWPRSGVEVKIYFFMTSAIEGVCGQHQAPAALILETLGSLSTEGWFGPRPVWKCERNLAPPGLDPRTVQPVVCGYNN
jgi:hypothetical protein